MAITFVAQSNTGYVSNPKTMTEPTGTASGDVMVAHLYLEDGNPGTTNPPAGWTPLTASGDHTGESNGMYFFQAYIVRGGSAPSLSWTYTNGPSGVLAVTTYRGVDTTTPIDAQGSWVQVALGGAGTSSVTTTTNNAMLIWVMGDYGNGGTGPAGMNSRIDVTALNVSDLIQAAAGASGSLTAAADVGPIWTRTIALREAGGGGAAATYPGWQGSLGGWW